MMVYHLIAFIGGFFLDLLLGDPYVLPHPIRLIGRFIGVLEKHFLGEKNAFGENDFCHEKIEETPHEHVSARDYKKEHRQGLFTVFIVCGVTVLIAASVLAAGYAISGILGCVLELIMTYQVLATKCLKVESMKVYHKLVGGTVEEARYAVSMIVGRDTKQLSETQVAKAAVETVAENTSDGSIAPMLYLAVGGPVLGLLYKAINTMDSMIGYKNERYIAFGKPAAKLDDFVNYIPARISALLMILSCFFLGKDYDGKHAFYIWKRDRYNHASPNSAQTESACAGALHIRLAGDASYFGKVVKKPFIGDDDRPVEYEDIRRANRLLYMTAESAALLCSLVMLLLWWIV